MRWEEKEREIERQRERSIRNDSFSSLNVFFLVLSINSSSDSHSITSIKQTPPPPYSKNNSLPMVLLITGATGGLGRGIIETLNKLGVPSTSYAGSTRFLSALPEDLKAKGIPFREVDFDRPSTLDPAFKDVTKLLIVSTNTFDPVKRKQQHRNAVDAAKRAGIARIYYTSLAFGGFGDSSKAGVMEAHLDTEEYLRASGVDYTIIREGLYVDAFPFFLNMFEDTRKVKLPADGAVAWSSREELAEGTAKLLVSEALAERLRNKTVVLTGPEAMTMKRTTEIVAQARGREIEFEIVSDQEYAESFVQTGKPKWLAAVWGTAYYGLEKGECELVDPLLEEVLGRKPTAGSEWIKKTLTENPSYSWHQQGSSKAA
jgi:uncharacterized protein YbjT (DUF2867 family)